MRENLDGIDVFVEAAQTGGFARAADRLALTRSAVGKTIARIEAKLGVRLFNRTTRSQSLTEAGQIYYERCLRALTALREGENLLASGQQEVAGRLRVTMPLLFGRYWAQPILLDLAARHPKLELDLRFSNGVVDLIGDGFDIAIRNHAPGAGPTLASRKIASQPKILCAAPAYFHLHGVPKSVAELPEHQSLAYCHRDQVFPWIFQRADGQSIQPALCWRLQFDCYEAIMDAAVRGMGLAWLPVWLVREHIRAKRLVPVIDGFSSVPVDTFAAWPAAQFLPMKMQVTIDALVQGLKSLGG